MGEIYAATFRRMGADVIATSDEIVIPPNEYELAKGKEWFGVGTGFAAENGALFTRFASCFARIDSGALPHAADLACLAALDYVAGKAVAPELVEPAYLRNNVALTLAEQQALRAKPL
jgi:tRNA threonylcarbamoyladenosine biosynthesis protein TsaB